MYRLKPSLRLRQGPAETFWVFDLESGSHFEVNETAFEVLRGLEAAVEPSVLARRVSEEYGIEEAEVMADIEELLATCVEDGLVTKEA
ncbi:MAG: PqqD family protein [Coriobacteriia bacterium]|nr:PqqD family protein [Coriobacteriia bacterium]